MRGFTLLEVVVAFVIAALALGVLYGAGVSGLHAMQTAGHYEQAISRARSHLAMAVHANPLVAGDWQGSDGDGFHWRIRVAPLASTTVQPLHAVTLTASRSYPLTLYAVDAWIAWRDGRAAHEVHLHTEQIGQGVR